MAALPTTFAQMFHLEAAGDGRFRGTHASHGGAAFGGETFGLATAAAARTCPDRGVNSLHIHFLRPIPGGKPVDFVVEETRNGRRIAHRRVEVQDAGRLLAIVVASFAAPTQAADFETVSFAPPPPPESLPSEEERARQEKWEGWEPEVVEWRWERLPWEAEEEATSRYAAWVRPTHPIEAGLRSAALAFVSDFHSHLPVARVLRTGFEPVGYASLDIVMWIHRDIPWDDFWCVTSVADIAHGGRALTRRYVHTRDGRLVATMMQEALIPTDAP